MDTPTTKIEKKKMLRKLNARSFATIFSFISKRWPSHNENMKWH